MTEISDKNNSREYTVLWSTEQERTQYEKYGFQKVDLIDIPSQQDDCCCCIIELFRNFIGSMKK